MLAFPLSGYMVPGTSYNSTKLHPCNSASMKKEAQNCGELHIVDIWKAVESISRVQHPPIVSDNKATFRKITDLSNAVSFYGIHWNGISVAFWINVPTNPTDKTNRIANLVLSVKTRKTSKSQTFSNRPKNCLKFTSMYRRCVVSLVCCGSLLVVPIHPSDSRYRFGSCVGIVAMGSTLYAPLFSVWRSLSNDSGL
jgi:hypothetical protein